MSAPIVKILITLDSLFDTRLGVLKTYNPNLVVPVLKNGYLKRITNKLSLFDSNIADNTLNELWINRNLTVLKNSELTMIIYYLMDDTLNTIGVKNEFPDSVKLNITVNTYPYVISSELWLKLSNSLKKILNVDTLNRSHLSFEQLSISYLSSNFKNFIVHDINEWSSFHQKQLMTPVVNNSLDRLTITAPILLGNDIDITELDETMITNIQRAEKLAFSSFFLTDFRPLRTFSIALEDDES